jgi:hypothetical protein
MEPSHIHSGNTSSAYLESTTSKIYRKTAILVIAHVPGKVLMYNYKTLIMRNNSTFAAYCRHRISATLCTSETTLSVPDI